MDSGGVTTTKEDTQEEEDSSLMLLLYGDDSLQKSVRDASELDRELTHTKEELRKSQLLCDALKRKSLALSKIRLVLQKNISVLYNTAVAEMDRKNREIASLKEKLVEGRKRSASPGVGRRDVETPPRKRDRHAEESRSRSSGSSVQHRSNKDRAEGRGNVDVHSTQ